MRKLSVLVLLAFIAAPAFCQSTDWPCWRGPNHDGVSLETGWNPEALKGGARVLWTADIGAGYSNIAIAQGRIYAMGKDRKSLSFVVCCLDAATGTVIWSNKTLRTYGEVESTPAVDGNRVYAMGTDGTLFCLDTATGALKWQKSMGKDYLAVANGGYGWAPSPVVDGDLILLNANGSGMALNKLTGNLAWLSVPAESGGSSCASPVPFGPAADRTVLFFGPRMLSAAKAATGEVLWSRVHNETMEVVADPLFQGNRVFWSHHDLAELLRMEGGKVSLDWPSTRLRSGLASPVLVNGYLYGQDWGSATTKNWDWEWLRQVTWSFLGMDWATGAVKWTRGMKFVSTSAAGGQLLVLEMNGTLHIADASPDAWRERSSADVLKGADTPRLFATPAVLSGGRIYCRNYRGDLICIDARK
jgi:outer membrane protein assembly factor BamB